MRSPLLMLFSLLLAGCDSEQSRGPADAPKPVSAGAREPRAAGRLDRSHAGEAAPSILFQDPTGKTATLADFRGKPVLVNLWATWCAPCVVEMPSLDALAAREPRLKVLALSQDLEGKAKVDPFFAERRFSKLEPFIDAELGMMTSLGVGTLPTTILYDGEGREVWRITGLEDWTGSRAKALIEEALSGQT